MPAEIKRRRAGTSKAENRLTSKREKFSQLIVAGENQGDAYRAAGFSPRMSDKTVVEAASRLMKDGKVLARIAELRQPVVAKLRYGLEQAMIECGRGMEMAKANKHSAAYISAVALRAKLNGLDVETRKNEREPFTDLSDDELERATAETRRALARAASADAAVGALSPRHFWIDFYITPKPPLSRAKAIA